jgi:hypothetical protein
MVILEAPCLFFAMLLRSDTISILCRLHIQTCQNNKTMGYARRAGGHVS